MKKIAEKVTEAYWRKSPATAPTLTSSGGRITIKAREEKKITIGGGEWPKGGAANLLPEFRKAQ